MPVTSTGVPASRWQTKTGCPGRRSPGIGVGAAAGDLQLVAGTDVEGTEVATGLISWSEAGSRPVVRTVALSTPSAVAVHCSRAAGCRR